MPEGWKRVRLGDAIELKRGYDLPHAERRVGLIPIVSSSGPTGWHDTAKAEGPGVVTGRYGTLGEVFYVREPFWPLNTTLYVRDFKGNCPRYIAYLLKTLNFSAYSDKSSVPGLNRNDLHEHAILLPPKSEQEAIADALGSLDDKIEQNRLTSEALERLARAIFRAWFIDFEPVKAKAAGAASFPSMPQDVFHALPREFADSAIGPIPDGWRDGSFGDLAREVKAGVKPGDVGTETPYIGLEHMPRRSIALAEWASAGKVTSGKSRFSTGDVLFGKLRPYFHKVGIAPIDGICSTDVVVIQPKAEQFRGIVVGCASSDEFVAHTDACSAGTKMPRTNWRDMARFSIAVPPLDVATVHSAEMRPMFDLIVAGVHESRKLAELRDYLLPKLLSGKVRVKDAERLAESA